MKKESKKTLAKNCSNSATKNCARNSAKKSSSCPSKTRDCN